MERIFRKFNDCKSESGGFRGEIVSVDGINWMSV